jgi:hypothetical protein
MLKDDAPRAADANHPFRRLGGKGGDRSDYASSTWQRLAARRHVASGFVGAKVGKIRPMSDCIHGSTKYKEETGAK